MDRQTAQNPRNLLDFSDEILLQIFENSTDIDLLTATLVCQRLKAIAKDAFAKRYNGESDENYYKINVHYNDGHIVPMLYYQFIKTFGNEINAIKIYSVRYQTWKRLIKLIDKHCTLTKHLIIAFEDSEYYDYKFPLTKMIKSMSSLASLTLCINCKNFIWAGIQFPHLKHLAIEKMSNLEIASLELFLQMNPKLEKLSISNCKNIPLSVFPLIKGNFARLKSLHYVTRENYFVENCHDIEMEQLEALEISVGETSFHKVLGAIARGSKMIQQMEVFWQDDTVAINLHQHFTEPFVLFERLTSLKLHNFNLTGDVIMNLVRALPKLVTLELDGITVGELSPEVVIFTFTTCNNLKKLLWDTSRDEHWMVVKEFNLDFHRRFANIVQNRNAKFELMQSGTKLEITNEKIIVNGVLFHWTGYDATKSCSKVHFFDLDDKCLENIYSYVDEDSAMALYETCTRTKMAMQNRINENEFTVSSIETAKDAISRFGEHITKLSIDMQTNDRIQMAETWKLISENCNQCLTELTFKNIQVRAMDSLKPVFPNLIKLKVYSMISSDVHIFPPMDCPKLTHLELHKGTITLSNIEQNVGVSFNSLNSIRLCHFSDGFVYLNFFVEQCL